jgi:Spy/CpxP family protein refolding chaperone
MSKKTFLWLFVVCLVLASFTASAVLAQDPDSSGASKGEVLSGDNSVQPGAPVRSAPVKARPDVAPGSMPRVDLSTMVDHNGQPLPDYSALKAQIVALVNGITAEQRAQIKAVLDANPSTHAQTLKATLGNPGDAAKAIDPGVMKAMDQSGQEWVARVNAGIRAVLTPEQAATFDATLPTHPDALLAKAGIQRSDITPQTFTDCDNSEFYNYYSAYFAYYWYYYAYYAYFTYGDISAYYSYALAYDTYFYWSWYAYYYSYYALVLYYSYYDAFYAWYYADHNEAISYAGWNLAYDGYYWVGDDLSYYSYYYAYYTWYYSDPYDAYYCWAS